MIQLQFLEDDNVAITRTDLKETTLLLTLLEQGAKHKLTVVIEQDTELIPVQSTPDILKPYYKMVSNKNHKILLQIAVHRVTVGTVTFVLINLPIDQELALNGVLSYD